MILPGNNSGDVVADVPLVDRLVCSLSVSCGSYSVVPCWKGIWGCCGVATVAMRCGDVLRSGDGIGWCRGDGIRWCRGDGMGQRGCCGLCSACGTLGVQFVGFLRLLGCGTGLEGPWGGDAVALVLWRCHNDDAAAAME